LRRALLRLALPLAALLAGGAAALASAQTATPAGETRRAVITHRPEAAYTTDASDHDIVGTVSLRVKLSETGKVTEVIPVRELPHGLTESAARAARGIRFKPAVRDGRPVAQWVTVEYIFDIAGRRRLSSHVKLLGGPKPEYAAEARARKVGGKVSLRVEFRADGQPVVVEVVRGLPHGLTESAVAAARQIKYEPAMKNGRPIGEFRNVEYTFTPNP
jgi:TonB family protein